MIELGVNIDHVATLRQARRTYEPDPVWAAAEAHLGGADGITVHLREDRRHIQDQDVRRLRELVHIKLNLEMAATDEMVGIACALKPEMAMLVPEGRQEVTTEGGLDIVGQEARLKDVVGRLAAAGIVTSVFIDAQIASGRGRGARRCSRLRNPHRPLRARLPRAGTRCRKRCGRRGTGEDPRCGRRRTRAWHALQRGPRAQLLQCATGRGACRECANCTSATPSSAARCSSACAKRCGR